MSETEHVIELISAYALGILDRDEEILTSEHLATCAACKLELRAHQSVVDQLALGVPDATPSTSLKRQLLARIHPPDSEPVPAPRPSRWGQLTYLWRRAAPAWGLVSVVLVVALVVSNLALRQQKAADAEVSSPMHIVAMVGTNAAASASGVIIISADGEYGTLVVEHMPVLDQALQYQLWLIRDGQRTDGGVFSVSGEGYGVLEIESHMSLDSFTDFGITIEPAGGSAGPTGDKVLGVSL